MKFKATVRDQRTLASVCQACRGIQRRCVIKLHPTRIRFFTSTQFADGMQVWAGCRTQAIFSDFQSQSQLQENAIFCEVADISQLFHIMRQAERCPNVTIKLTKNAARRPALRVSMQGVRPHLDISHDVPVRVLSELEVRNISAPPLESEVVQIVLPCLTELSKFVDKVRSTSCDRMTFTVRDNERADGAAATSCTLVVLAECFLASFALKYSSVKKCEREGENDADFDGEGDGNGGDKPKHRDDKSMAYASVSVEVRRFARFLAIKEATPLQVVLHLVDGKAVVLSVFASGGTTLVGYMPAVAQ
ncbi:putative Checkpoint protein HUS1 [Trypanosoma cruzi]|uniref:Checkpoint protein n=1 Tax=Trypanosoma cruzi TaxID=5693 RepID=A0A2V2UM03_TRYCR|nr:putative Checkpoint protein HUS1 [Trypanosoma cruzi]